MPDNTPDPALPASDGELASERAFLDRARAWLRDMHTDVLATETVQDSSEDADYTFTNRLLAADRERRARALADLPDAPLFFGRLDHPPGSVFEPAPGEAPTHTRTAGADRVYIGRRHVHDPQGSPVVLDWRAPVSAPFYRASATDPMGALLRRRYGFSDAGDLTAFEDEVLDPSAAQRGQGDGGANPGAILAAEIERPRTGPMRDIVATIQPEQDELVRAPLRPALCVQGAPGTGKTAVGLHRIAYLLYNDRERLRSEGGVAILGPNRSFLSYIRRVLPALGEVGVRQTTVEELTGDVPVRREDTPQAARIKGDARMAEVIRRGLWARPAPLDDTLVVSRGSRKWRLYPEDLAAVLDELRGRGIAYGSGPGLLSQRLAHTVMCLIEDAGEACDASTLSELRRNRAITAAVRAMWPKAEPVRLVLDLLTDPALLARAAEGVLSAQEQEAILMPGKPRGPKSARWTAADLALIDEAAALIERPSALGHIVVDEAQDLSPMQCRAVARRCTRSSMTVLGDIAQATSPSAVGDWPRLLEHLGVPDAHLAVLDRGFRVPAQIIDFAARVLPHIAPGLVRPVGVRAGAPDALRIRPVAADAVPEEVALACREALKGEGSVGVIAADAEITRLHRHLETEGLEPGALDADGGDVLETARLVCVPASLAKGLEFDTVVVAEPTAVAEAEDRGLQRLYVALTRAVSVLHVVHARPLPDLLTAAS
ncbi:HelD family protein [Nocardiopsis chromatogenes]|uniref:HelD family protein n=1 Tax=Nocardiopsis chromatogenes TaxID=280239 RepID=UPI000345FADA|nr:ATP-binding domain-containing protein [Nocardiopsis chromatogenes]